MHRLQGVILTRSPNNVQPCDLFPGDYIHLIEVRI